MYCIMLNANHATLTIVSQWSIEYPVYMQLNYEVLFTGTKRDCENQLEQLDQSAGW